MRDCLEIEIIDDTKLEDMEYFTVSLERFHGVNNKFVLKNLERNVTIIDMDSMSQAMMYFMLCFVMFILIPIYVDLLLTCFSFPEAFIGFQNYHYSVNEDIHDYVTVCAVVEYPPQPCDIDFAFNISLVTRDGSAGMNV